MPQQHTNRRSFKYATACLLLAATPALADNYWWRGDLSSGWATTASILGTIVDTNWATSSTGVTDRLSVPGSGDIVRFASSNAINLNNSLGLSFSISGLTTETALTGNVTISGSILNFDFNSVGITTNAPRTLTLNSVLTSNSTELAINTANASSVVNINSSFSGLVGLTKSGTGTLNLSNVNSYTLYTAVTAGVLNATVANALPSGRPLTVGQGATPTLGRVNTGGFAQSVSSLAMFARDAANPIAVDVGAGTLTVTGNISVLDTSGSQGNAFGVTIAATPGGTLNLGGGVRNVTIAGQNVSQSDLIINPVITNGGINLTANPSSTLLNPAGMVLNASSPNTYTGGTTVNAGTLTVNSSTTLGPGSLLLNTTGSVDSKVIFNNSAQTITSLGTSSIGTAIPAVVLNGTVLEVNQSANSIFNGTIGGTGMVGKSGNGTLTLARQNSYTGGTVIVGGTLTTAAANALPIGRPLIIGEASTVASGRLNTGGFSQSISSLILFARTSASQAAIDVGSGTLTLNGDVSLLDTQDFPGNAFGATIAASAGGTLNLGAATRNFTIAGQNVSLQELVINAVIANGGISVNANPSSTVLNGAGMVLNAAGPNTYGGGTILNAGRLTVNSTTTLGNGPLTLNTTGNVESRVVFNNATQSVTILQTGSLGSANAVVALNGTALTVGSTATRIFAGIVTGTGSLIKVGTGNLTLAGNNTFSGGTTVSAGTLQLGGGGTSGTVAGNITNNAFLVFNRSDNSAFAGAISGSGNLTHAASSTLTLSGALTYTGDTSVSSGGKLVLNSALNTTTGDVLLSTNGKVDFAAARAAVPVVVSRIDNLTVPAGSIAWITPSTRTGGLQQGVLIVKTLSITGSGFLDLTNNDMVVRGQSVASVRALVGGWYTADAGLPGTRGLGSSESFYTVAGAFTTLAVFDNSIAGQTLATFDGVAVLPTDVLVKYTYLGDTNIDGVVDASDLLRVLQGMNGLGSGWNFGDVNYDGVVNFVDLGRTQAALRGQGAPLGGGELGGGGVIPEPASLGLVLAAVPLMGRRRR